MRMSRLTRSPFLAFAFSIAGIFSSFATLKAQLASQQVPAKDKSTARVTVDTKKSEVRLPCRFVNPTRQLEVFACHSSGPTHETVVVFDARGEELVDALEKIGCRPADYWNASSPGDFLRNQGDRVLVLLRWKSGGVTHEFPAEAMLMDGATGFASFVRGFSFNADLSRLAELSAPRVSIEDDLPGGDETSDEPDAGASGAATNDDPGGDAAPRIPRTVEITLGATSRRNAVFSLLSHPTTLSGGRDGSEGRALQPWSFPPIVHPRIVPDLRELVEKEVPATLIFRRYPSETALLRYVRSIASARGVDDRLPLYEKLEPIFAEIDRLKAAYVDARAATRALLETRLDLLPQESHGDFALYAESLQRLGRWYGARLQERFFSVYLLQDRFRLASLKKRPLVESEDEERLDAIHPRVLDQARSFTEDGLHYEPLLAERELALARGAVDELLVRREVRDLELARYEKLVAGQLRQVSVRRSELDATDAGDRYVLRLLEEDEQRFANTRRELAARRQILGAVDRSIRSHLDGSHASVQDCLVATLAAGTEGLAFARLELELLDLREGLRWEEGDSDDGEEGVTPRERKARQKLAELRKREKVLEATIDGARKKLRELNDAQRRACGRGK